MVEQAYSLDNIFTSLADPTRRDILLRVSNTELSISQIALPYDLSFAAVSKHIKVLEKAKLVIKRKSGKEQIVRLAPNALANAYGYLDEYKRLWGIRLDALEEYLK